MDKKKAKKFMIIGWLNIKTMEPFWGIKTKLDNGRTAFVCTAGIPLFFNKESEAIAKVRELNKSEQEKIHQSATIFTKEENNG